MPDGSAKDGFGEISLHADAEPDSHIVDLRILATTDLHMHLFACDYLTGLPSDTLGLARTAALVAQHRRQTANCLLFDNGDFLQGSALGDYAATQDKGQAHPAIAAMNALGYDACALGNHDFSFGLPFLRRAVVQARFPVLSANLHIHHGPGFARYAILRRRFADRNDHDVDVSVGVVGFLPPQTVEWDRDLSHHMRCEDIVESAHHLVPRMRADGAQIIVALAHTGIGSPSPQPFMEHAATALAGVDGIDCVIAGHTHQVFPGDGFSEFPGIDAGRGTLAGKPAVMAGFGGSHLGVIDLRLQPDPDRGWRVTGSHARAEAVPRHMAPDTQITAPALKAHRAALRGLRRRVGRSALPMNSYFAVIGEDAGLRLVAAAQRWHVRSHLRNTIWADLPVLSAAAPFRAGGRSGPACYTDVAPGRLSHRSLADLYAFPNRLAAVVLDGAQVHDWLERAASLFAQITDGTRDGPLLDPDFPCYNFDIIDGLRWQIDLSQPARFAPGGTLVRPDAHRVGMLTWNKRPVTSQDRFVLATNSYRLAGCGLFSPLVSHAPIALDDPSLTRDVLHRYVRRRRHLAIEPRLGWSFRPMPGSSAVFDTGPGGLEHMPGLSLASEGRLQRLGRCPKGFERIRLLL